jgi:beta-lactamase regulating signal transducer with metallopeptidase domain
MNLSPGLHSIATTAAERLLFGVAVGTLLAVAVWFLLRALGIRDSRTSFAVWFSTLVLTALLPLFGLHSQAGSGAAGGAVVTISSWWALAMFVVWALAALAGLVRVALALLQVYRLRSSALPVDGEILETQLNGAELRALMGECKRSRLVEVLVSDELEVPTAVGFFRPAVLLPRWLLEGTPADELKYIILHELEHLRRRDDWTNLAQQVVRALLFFVPSVWWIERRLSLDREMACDDAVLARCGTPQGYARCLAHVAERSFLRRQVAMAQAAVARLRQLTLRVTRILDPNRQHSQRLWKPAVPAVVIVAGLCVFSASQGPTLVGFADTVPVRVAAQKPAASATTQISAVASPEQSAATNAGVVRTKFVGPSGVSAAPKVKAWDASLRSGERMRKAGVTNAAHPRRIESKTPSSNRGEEQRAELAAAQLPAPAVDYVTVREEFYMVVTRQTATSAPTSWQVHVVEVSVVPVKPAQKQVPRKI